MIENSQRSAPRVSVEKKSSIIEARMLSTHGKDCRRILTSYKLHLTLSRSMDDSSHEEQRHWLKRQSGNEGSTLTVDSTVTEMQLLADGCYLRL